jgi:hypothetical protein
MTIPIIALGGHSHAAPSDTLPAYWAGLGIGADGLAINVQQTRDGRLVCAPGPAATYAPGGDETVEELRFSRFARLDAGATFRSSLLDSKNRVLETGDDAPWARRGSGRPIVTHPSLDHVLLTFSRRTSLLLWLLPAAGREESMATELSRLLTRFGILERVQVAGTADVVRSLDEGVSRCLVDSKEDSAGFSVAECSELGASAWIAAASRVDEADDESIAKLVLADEGSVAPSREQTIRLRTRPDTAGWLVSGVDRMVTMQRGRGLMLTESFSGPDVDRKLWSLGKSRSNEDTTITVDHGLTFDIDGSAYSGGAAVTAFSVHGAFDARISYEVANPTQGTTFELAAVHVDAGYHRPNLTFDVHGAPPYASSERDEADGFRIGWNNGPALTRWRVEAPQSSNLYNNYSPDVGDASAGRPEGSLRLTRFGAVFNAYYRDESNPEWVLCGSATVPALAQSVFLRLGAKHWPKRGKPAPDNWIRLYDFELYQW